MKTETHKEGVFGRLKGLLTGGAKPRRAQSLMVVLLVLGVLSLAGVVSADNYWKGQPPVTGDRTGSVTGDIDVLYANTWTSPDNIVTDSNWANFTLQAPDTGKTLKFARLYVVVYSGNQTANFKGNETIKLYNDNTLTSTLADHQPLDLNYVNTSGMICNSSVSVPPFTSTTNGLCRVTSDYLNIFDVTSSISGRNVNVNIQTWNESLDINTGGVGRFDGRIKEAKLVYGWDDSSSSTVTRYWINEGQDPSTSADPDYVGVSEFNGITNRAGITNATLYTDDIASANGTYGWNDDPGTLLPATIASNSYARLNRFYILPSDVLPDNEFNYDRYGNNSYYKLALAILKLKY